MTVEELQREQDAGVPKDDLTAYAGQWVALRDGRVVASDLNGVALRDMPEVRATDTLMFVPTSPSGSFLL